MKKQLPVPAIAAIVVLALIVVGYFGYHQLAGPSYPAVKPFKQLHDKVVDIAIASGGDYDKLNPADKQYVDEISRGNGKRYLLNTFKHSQSGGTK